MIRSLFTNLRARFLFLVLLAVLPALGLLIYTASEQRDQAVAIERRGVGRVAEVVAASQGRLIESARQLLLVISRYPEVQQADESCDQLLSGLLGQFDNYTNLAVVAPNGEVLCSAIAPMEKINLAERADIRGAFETGEFTVGEYQAGSVSDEPVLTVAYPVQDESGAVTSVVFAALDLASFGQIPGNTDLPDGSIVTLFDRNGTVLVRRPQDEFVSVGQSLAGDPTFATILSQGEGVTEGQIGDQTYVFAFSTLSGESVGNAYLSIAIPKSEILANAESAFSRNLTRLGLVVVVVMVAAWVGGDLLGRRNADAHKELVRRIYDAFTTGGVDLLDDVVDQRFVDHDPMPGQAPGLPGLKQAVGLFRAAFPDGEMIVNELVAEGDKVVARVTLHGTHTGDYFGRKGTGRIVMADGIEIFQISGDKVCAGWSRFVLPTDGATASTVDAEGTMSPIDDPNGVTPGDAAVDRYASPARDT